MQVVGGGAQQEVVGDDELVSDFLGNDVGASFQPRLRPRYTRARRPCRWQSRVVAVLLGCALASTISRLVSNSLSLCTQAISARPVS